MPARNRFLLTSVLLLLGTLAGGNEMAAAEGLPAAAAADTVRTNLWLTEALMGEIVTAVLPAIPPAPGTIRLLAKSEDDARNDLFRTVAVDVLSKAGYRLYAKGGEPDQPAEVVDYVFEYNVQDIDLSYPAVGRTLGIWRRWIDRDLGVSAIIEVKQAATGRLLFSERLARRYGDRLDNGDFSAVDADVYEFTTAEPSESGWQGRMEEIVVLGSLAGLVAIYFANTGN